MNTSCKLKLDNITAGFKDKIVIEDINLELHEGQILCILGKSGIGKSTLLNVISGLLKPFGGRVYLNGEDITHETGHISYMLQKDLLLPFKTVEENIALPLIIKGEKREDALKKVSEMTGLFGLDDYKKEYPSSLSGGMRQRAALLRSYLFSTDVVLLDEPFSALDYLTKYKMHQWYLDISKKFNISTIFITHDIDEALKLADIIHIMKGNPASLYKGIKNDHKEEVLNQNFLEKKKQILHMLEID